MSSVATTAATSLLDSGIFDHDYYATLSSLETMSPLELAEHYVRTAAAAAEQLSPHPLIELEHLPTALRSSLKGPEATTHLLSYLRSERARHHSWGPLFDPRKLDSTNANPLEALSALSQDDHLPVPEGFLGEPPTLAEARSTLLAFQQRYRKQFDAHLPPRRDTWDDNATQAWLNLAGLRATQPRGKVTVVMPVFNREAIVSAAIRSVLAQSYPDFELLVVDDGSTDDTRTVIEQFMQEDSRVRLLSGHHDGVSVARNLALHEATGDYVAFLDSDNEWTPRFLELSLGSLNAAPNVVATHAGLRLHGDGGAVSYRGGDVQFDDLQLGNSVDLNVLVVRATTLLQAGPFDTTLRRWVDYELVLRLAKLGRLEYLPFVGCEYDDRSTDGRITRNESVHWQWVARERNLVDWPKVQSNLDHRVSGRVSVVTVVAGMTAKMPNALDRLLETSDDRLEVIIVDNGSRAAVGRKLVARYIHESRVRYVRLAANNNFATAANYGFSLSTGTFVAFLDSDADPRDGWLDSLIRKQRSSGALGVQSLLLNPDYTVQHAGYAFFGRLGIPAALLAGLTIDDATHTRLDELTAISASASLYDANGFASLRGFDPIFANGLEDVDFCLRALESRNAEGLFACEPRALVIHDRKPAPSRSRRESENRRIFSARWQALHAADDRTRYEQLSLQVTHLAPRYEVGQPPVVPVLARPRSVDPSPGGQPTPSLRWALKTGVPCTRGGDRWGDIPFAADLAEALRARGQQVVTDRHDAWNRPTAYLDDVVLTLRGRHRIPPQPGAINMMWVISRPNLVTVDEVQSYDVVFAASEKWAEWMTAQSGRRIEPLLQATSPKRFHPAVPLLPEPDDIIFVGGSHGHEHGRAIVGLALQANASIGLWGPDWSKLAPVHAQRGQYLDSEALPSAYRSANIVLNDHFEDMAEWGFINNRTFDAVACGTPMISDTIDGLELFEGAVVAADSVERMRELVNDRTWMPSSDEMARLSSRIRAQHSFQARAERLLRAALECGAS